MQLFRLTIGIKGRKVEDKNVSMATAKAIEPTVFCWGETVQLILYHKDWWNLVDNKISKIFESRRQKHCIVVTARRQKGT